MFQLVKEYVSLAWKTIGWLWDGLGPLTAEEKRLRAQVQQEWDAANAAWLRATHPEQNWGDR